MANPAEEEAIMRLGEFAVSPEYKNTPAAQQVHSDREHKRIGLYMRMSGLDGIDPESEQGKLIQSLSCSYQAMAATGLPFEMAMKLVVMAVETEILRKAAFTWVTRLRPDKDYTTPEAMSFRQTYQTATGAYKGFAALLMQIMKMLNDGGTPAPNQPQDLQAKLLELKKSVQGDV